MSGDAEDVPGWWARLAGQSDAVIPLVPVSSRPPVVPRPTEPPKSGILNIAKPLGMTSHDVVQAVRKASGERRVGHAGTLDPLARGVLVVCLGSATRVIEEVQATRKTYVAIVRLGEATTTYDAEGEVTLHTDPSQLSHVSHDQVEAALAAFRGDILQTPPMYSALKHQGRRLYDLARQGIEVERPARPVSVYDLRITDWSLPDVTLTMTVSSGTYVRSIAHDLGSALGVGAHLAGLERTAVGSFTLADAEPLHRVVEAFVDGWWPALLHPLDTALLAYSALIVDDASEAALRNGQQIPGPPPGPTVTHDVRAYHKDGRFIGLLRWDDVSERWQPTRIFPRAG
jgi:tRNA pseudouridine55 synthase